MSKSHAKFNMSHNNYLNAVTKVPNTNTHKKSSIALKTMKTALPYAMTLNSPIPSTKISKYTNGLSGSPLRRMKSPHAVDRGNLQLTDMPKLEGNADQSALSLKQSKNLKSSRAKIG